jgi:hypothetical protein
MDVDRYDIHINFPGGVPVDGRRRASLDGGGGGVGHRPRAGGLRRGADGRTVGLRKGAAGGLRLSEESTAAVKGRIEAGADSPENHQAQYGEKPIQVIPIESLAEALVLALGEESGLAVAARGAHVLAAEEA